MKSGLDARRASRWCAVPWLAFAAVALPGCSSMKAVEAALPVAEKALEVVGLKKPAAPELPDAAKPARRIALRVQASPSLNVDEASGASLSLVARIYKLRSADAFLAAPYETFGDAALEKERLGNDLVEVRDLQLVPGQRVEATEKVTREAAYVGVVALFHSPAAQRWRYAFAADELERSGLTLGAHACALTVSSGVPLGMSADFARSSPGQCR